MAAAGRGRRDPELADGGLTAPHRTGSLRNATPRACPCRRLGATPSQRPPLTRCPAWSEPAPEAIHPMGQALARRAVCLTEVAGHHVITVYPYSIDDKPSKSGDLPANRRAIRLRRFPDEVVRPTRRATLLEAAAAPPRTAARAGFGHPGPTRRRLRLGRAPRHRGQRSRRRCGRC